MDITTNEAAEKLGVKIRQVQSLIKQGRLPARKLGRDWIINSDDLDLVKDRPITGRPKKITNE